jgi:hypothetical protein
MRKSRMGYQAVVKFRDQCPRKSGTRGSPDFLAALRKIRPGHTMGELSADQETRPRADNDAIQWRTPLR